MPRARLLAAPPCYTPPRSRPHRPPQFELLEPRLVLNGPTLLPDGSLEITLDETLDQFGFQVAMFQSYENFVSFSIFDTGASVVTISATDQFLFDLFGDGGVPIKVRCGASAEGVGGTLTGHVSEPGTVMADGLHVAALTFDEFGFPVFDIQFDPRTAAIVPGIQTFVGALLQSDDPGGCPRPASEVLPTITGTPILEPTIQHPDGSAALVRPLGELLDFSDFPELNGLVIPVPDLTFQLPGIGIPDDPDCARSDGGLPRDICTEPVRVALDFVGINNYANPGDVPTESFNPVQNHVRLEHHGIVQRDLVFLFDTGAQLSIISSTQAEALGLDLDHPQTTISVQGAAGSVLDVPGYTIDRLVVPLLDGGELIFKDVPIYVLDVAEGLLDGIIGMNLFNYAAGMLYDPYHPRGPLLELTFFTENQFGDIDLGGDGFSLFQLLMPGLAATLRGSAVPGVGSRSNSPPLITVAAPQVTGDSTPSVTVSIRDDSPIADGTPVSIDLDLNLDGDFADPGEPNYLAATFTGGISRFELTPPLNDGTIRIRARAADSAGMEGTSSVRSIVVDLTPPTLAEIPAGHVADATSHTGAAVSYSLPTASDNHDTAPAIHCSPTSGSHFPVGDTVVTCTTTDHAGNSSSAEFTVTVNPPASRITFNAGVLTIIGTELDDTIQLVRTGKGLRIDTTFGSLVIPKARSLTRLLVESRNGNDTIQVARLSAAQSSVIDAGSGNDTVTGGAGSDIVLGGAGSDLLNGMGGDNFLVGGLGNDRLLAGRNSDLLLGGRLGDSDAPVDLSSLLAAWRAARTATAKRAIIQPIIDHALDDGIGDILIAGKGIDVFIAAPLDVYTDRRPDDLVA